MSGVASTAFDWSGPDALPLMAGLGLLGAILEHSAAGVAYFDPDLLLRAANERFARQVIGRPFAELIGQPAEAVIPAWTPEMALLYHRVRDTGHPFHVEASSCVLAPAASPCLARWDTTLAPVYGEERSFAGWLLLCTALTGRAGGALPPHTLQALELQGILASAGDGLVVYDAEARIARMSRSAADMLGCSLDGEHRPLCQGGELPLQTPDGQPLAAEQHPALRALRGEVVRAEGLLACPPGAGPRRLQVSAAAIRHPSGAIAGAVLSLADVTAWHEQYEQTLDILRAVSHDLRSPLTAVLAQAQLLQRKLERAGCSEGERRSLQSIIASARRMNAMIADLADAAHMESGQIRVSLQPVDVPTFLGELLPRLASYLDTARVRVEMPEGLAPVLADPDRLDRIVTNLLSNALKYSPPGREVTVAAVQDGAEVVISVSDHGPGIPPDELPALFQRYWRAEIALAGREGMGLGLYVSKKLLEAQGGRIWVQSEVGVGSKFSFALRTVAAARSSGSRPGGP